MSNTETERTGMTSAEQDVEAHGKKIFPTLEDGDDRQTDDVEAHGKRNYPTDDDNDDVEAHAKKPKGAPSTAPQGPTDRH
jgi:hypothetical protein